MPERKSHVKSRLGCAQCKHRRVKCDEQRPACGNCKRRQESCSYKNANPPNESPSPDAADLVNAVSGSERLRQLELMHHYCTSTYETIALGPRPGSTQLIEVPRLAFTYEFLLDTVFAIASLHLAYLNPTEAHIHVANAVRYHDRALVVYQQRLELLQVSECQALYHCSSHLGVIALALRVEDTAATQRPTETLVQLATLWRGTLIILKVTKEMIDPDTYEMSFPEPDWDPRRTDPSFNETSQRFIDLLRKKAKEGDEAFNGTAAISPATVSSGSPQDEDVNMSGAEDTTAVYLDTIDHLQFLYQAVRLEKSRILAFLAMLPREFHGYLSQQRPLAMCIIMVYSVFMRAFEGYWWARNFHRALLDELVPFVSRLGPEFAEMSEWARTCVVNAIDE